MKVHMIEVYEGFNDLRTGKLSIKYPSYFLSLKEILSNLQSDSSGCKIYFANPESKLGFYNSDVEEQYRNVTYTLFKDDPKTFGVMCYKNKHGKIVIR